MSKNFKHLAFLLFTLILSVIAFRVQAEVRVDHDWVRTRSGIVCIPSGEESQALCSQEYSACISEFDSTMDGIIRIYCEGQNPDVCVEISPGVYQFSKRTMSDVVQPAIDRFNFTNDAAQKSLACPKAKKVPVVLFDTTVQADTNLILRAKKPDPLGASAEINLGDAPDVANHNIPITPSKDAGIANPAPVDIDIDSGEANPPPVVIDNGDLPKNEAPVLAPQAIEEKTIPGKTATGQGTMTSAELMGGSCSLQKTAASNGCLGSLAGLVLLMLPLCFRKTLKS